MRVLQAMAVHIQGSGVDRQSWGGLSTQQGEDLRVRPQEMPLEAQLPLHFRGAEASL